MTLLWIIVGVGAVVLVVAVLLSRVTAGDGAHGTIEGYVGRPGQGKTTLGVQHAIRRALLTDATIIANIGITHPTLRTVLLPHTTDGLDMRVLLTTAYECMAEGRAIVVFIDEAGIAMPARFWATFGSHMMFVLQQSRKLYCELIWTAQSETFVDAQLRELTAATHSVSATPPATVARRRQGKRPWWVTVQTWDRTNVGSQDAHLGTSRVRYRRAYEAFFNTDQIVLPPLKVKGADELVDLLRKLVGTPEPSPALIVVREPDAA